MGIADPVVVSERLLSARLAAGLSQRELARLAVDARGRGLTAAYISRIESADRQPSLDALVLLADTLGVTALWLLGHDGPERCIVCGRAGRKRRS
jgi:transcriptional regulator with XRE-family HTH domain